ncbi:MAG: putative toxin-antitoxin system toxin component, PIN family [Bacteroidaceae bacterium]|nr:putative toxin-antitoxin system toxin component, PIN family [Bacteroidaceae bacterium]MBQ9666819.1 putative toxin-antitoxin system toxin component, PIN family [Bacteroidaceae bacterium]
MPRKIKLRVIVDTNCWISFLIGRRLGKLVDLLSDEHIQLIICDELLDEIREVASRPKFVHYFPQPEVESLLEFMQLIGEKFVPTQQVAICRDKADDYLLALAIDSHAHYLVTGDQDLLVLLEVSTCRIVDAPTFEREILSHLKLKS